MNASQAYIGRCMFDAATRVEDTGRETWNQKWVDTFITNNTVKRDGTFTLTEQHVRDVARRYGLTSYEEEAAIRGIRSISRSDAAADAPTKHRSIAEINAEAAMMEVEHQQALAAAPTVVAEAVGRVPGVGVIKGAWSALQTADWIAEHWWVIPAVIALIGVGIMYFLKPQASWNGGNPKLETSVGSIDASTVAIMAATRGRAKDAIVHDAACVCDECSQSGFFVEPGSGLQSVSDFYVTPSSRVSIAPLPPGEFGRTYLTDRPFRIEITPDATRERQRLTLIHELLHVYDETHKLKISHEELHGLSYYILSEVIPGITTFNNLVGNR